MRLSICIATFNRADYIGETLDSILPQLVDGVELVVLDGNSPDDTAAVVGTFAERCPALRYIRAETNSGIDRDYDKAVQAARGRHVWLFSDDDTIVPGGIAAVLAELADGDPDLLVVDSQVRDINLRRVFEAQRMRIRGRHDYGPAEYDRLLADAGDALSFIGGVVIRRSTWLERDRESYFGTLFIHAGVIFQQPPLERVRVLAEPLVRIRMGNAMWSGRSYEIWMLKWPDLVWSFAGLSDAAKAKVVARDPWRRPFTIATFRAYGSLTRDSYRRFVAPRASARDKLLIGLSLLVPGIVWHVAMMLLVAATRLRRGSIGYNLLIASPHANPLSRAIGRLAGIPAPAPRERP